jgi:chitosanase
MELQDFQLKKIAKVLCVFETSKPYMIYNEIYIYPDGIGGRKQLTLGIGFTSDSGSLRKVLQNYIDINGKSKELIIPYLSVMGTKDAWKNKDLIQLLITLGTTDDKFKQAQDNIFATDYLKKGMNYNKEKVGLKTALGLLVIQDSILHGSINLVRELFSEACPLNGGDEKKWIKAYCIARRKWWLNHSKNPQRNIEGKGTYRMDCFLKAIENNNWDLSLPLTTNGVLIK